MCQGYPLLDAPTHTRTRRHARLGSPWVRARHSFCLWSVMEYTQLETTWPLVKHQTSNASTRNLGERFHFSNMLLLMHLISLYSWRNICKLQFQQHITAAGFFCVWVLFVFPGLLSCKTMNHCSMNQHRNSSEKPRACWIMACVAIIYKLPVKLFFTAIAPSCTAAASLSGAIFPWEQYMWQSINIWDLIMLRYHPASLQTGIYGVWNGIPLSLCAACVLTDCLTAETRGRHNKDNERMRIWENSILLGTLKNITPFVLNNTDSSRVSLSTCSRPLPATEFNEKIIISTVHEVFLIYQILLTCWHKLWVGKQTAHPNLKCFSHEL